MNCSHLKSVSYSLTKEDKRDFCQRLEDFLGNHEQLAMEFLTPTDSKRGHRAKSMLTTQMTSTVRECSSLSKLLEIETDTDEFASGERRRSSGRRPRRSTFLAPSKFFNCQECGAIYFHELCVAIKPRQYCYRVENVPSGLLCSFFILQANQKKIYLRPAAEMDDPFGQQLYLNGRKRIIDGVYKMGCKFQQARETIHIAIEIIDQYYLRMSQVVPSEDYKDQFMHPRLVIMHQVTALLLASKYDEVDDNITAIRDLRQYVTTQLQNLGKKDMNLVPTFEQIVECERRLLSYFDWNLNFLLPLHFIRLQLANGILFTNELKVYEHRLSADDFLTLKQELTKMLTTEALSLSDLLISKGACFLRKEQPSNVAAAIIYFTRKNILFSDKSDRHVRVPTLWPEELILMTRCTEAQIKKLLQNPLEETYSADLAAASAQKGTSNAAGQQQTNSTANITTNDPKSKHVLGKTADSNRRQLIGQEISIKKERKVYNTLSPPAKPITNTIKGLNTESKPNERLSNGLNKDSLVVNKKTIQSVRVASEPERLTEESVEKKKEMDGADQATSSNIDGTIQINNLTQTKKPQEQVQPTGGVSNLRVHTFRQNLMAASTSNLRLNPVMSSNQIGVAATDSGSKPMTNSGIGSGLLPKAGAGSLPSSTKNANSKTKGGLHGTLPTRHQQQQQVQGQSNVGEQRISMQYIPQSISMSKSSAVSSNAMRQLKDLTQTGAEEVKLDSQINLDTDARTSQKSADSHRGGESHVVNASLPDILNSNIAGSAAKNLFEPMISNNHNHNHHSKAITVKQLHVSQVSVGSCSTITHQQLPISTSKRPSNTIGFSGDAAQQNQQPQATKATNSQQEGGIASCTTKAANAATSKYQKTSKNNSNSHERQKSRQNSKNLNRNNGGTQKTSQTKIVLPQSVQIQAQLAIEQGCSQQPAQKTRNEQCNSVTKSVPDNASLLIKMKSTELPLPQVQPKTSTAKSTECFNLKAAQLTKCSNATTSGKEGKGSCPSKIGVVDEAINNSAEVPKPRKSKQKMSMPMNNANQIGAATSVENGNLVKVMKGSSKTLNKNALISPPTMQLKTVNQKIAAQNGPARGSKAFHKIAASMVSTMTHSTQGGAGFGSLKQLQHSHKMKGNNNNCGAHGRQTRGGSQESMNQKESRKQKNSSKPIIVQLDFASGANNGEAAAFKSTDFYQTSKSGKKKKEVSPVPTMSSLPTIGQLSGKGTQQQMLQQENNGQLANLMEAPNKERYSSVDKQHILQETAPGGKTVTSISTQLKLFAKHGKLDRKQGSVVGSEISKQGSSTNVRQITTSTNAGPAPILTMENNSQNPGFSKNKSQYFGGKMMTPSQAIPQSNTNPINSQRMVLNAIRKGPSFAGMQEISTPSGAQEQGSAKGFAAPQASHRVLTKGSSHQMIQTTTANAIKQSGSGNLDAVNKFAKNASKTSGRNHHLNNANGASMRNNGSNKAKNNLRQLKLQQQPTASLLQAPSATGGGSAANISQTLIQVANTAISSKQGSVIRKAPNSGTNSVFYPNEKEQLTSAQQLITRRATKVNQAASSAALSTNAAIGGPGSPVIQTVRPTPQALVNKNRNYNTAANLAGTIPSVVHQHHLHHHGLINANFTTGGIPAPAAASSSSVVTKTSESKGSFQSSSCYTAGKVLEKQQRSSPNEPTQKTSNHHHHMTASTAVVKQSAVTSASTAQLRQQPSASVQASASQQQFTKLIPPSSQPYGPATTSSFVQNHAASQNNLKMRHNQIRRNTQPHSSAVNNYNSQQY